MRVPRDREVLNTRFPAMLPAYLFSGLPFLFAMHATSSISLTLLNKSIAMAFPFPFHILILQNLCAICLTLLFGHLQILDLKPIRWSHLRRMTPLSLMYVALLWSSLSGLAKVSVSTVVIGRSLIPLFTSLLERFTLRTRFNTSAYGALFLIFVGSALYAYSERQPNFEGISYVMLNVALSVIMPVLEKKFVQELKSEQTAPGLVAYRNIISMPVLLLLSPATSGGISAALPALLNLQLSYQLVLQLSCLFSFTIGMAVFYLQTRVTATTIVTANNWYKLLTLLSSLFFWALPFEPLGWLGIAINFAGLFAYSYIQAATPGGPSTPPSSSNEQEQAVELQKVAGQSGAPLLPILTPAADEASK